MPSSIVPTVDLAPGMPSRTVTVSATDITEGGQSMAGAKVTFALSDSLDVASGGDVIARRSATIELDSNGDGAIRLPVYSTKGKTWCGADDDWAILVSTSWGSSKAIRVPAGSSSIALSALPNVRPLTAREKLWAITGAGITVTEGSQWGATVTLNGGVLNFNLTVPPGGTAWHLGTVYAASNLNDFKSGGITTFSASADPSNRPEGASPAGHLWVLPYGGLAVEQIWLDVGGGWYANRSSDSTGSFGPWKRSIDQRITAAQIDGLYSVPGLVFDDFNRANGSLGTPTSGGTAWAATAGTGTTGIAVNAQRVKAWTGSGNSHAYVPAGTNVTVTATVAAVGASPIAGVVARYVDDTNHLVAQLRESDTKTTYTLFERRGSTALYPLVTSDVTPKVGDRFGVRAVGGSAQLVVNGVAIGGAVTERTGTLAGVYFNGDDLVTAFDDFTVTEA